MILQQCTTCHKFTNFKHVFKVALRPDFIYGHRLLRQNSQLNAFLRKPSITFQSPALVSRLGSTLKCGRLFCTNGNLEDMLEGHLDGKAVVLFIVYFHL